MSKDSRSFEVLLDRFLSNMAVHNYSEQTCLTTKRHCRAFARWCEDRGIWSPLEVSREVIERYQRWLFHYRQKNGKPLAFSTQALRLSRVRNFFAYLVKERYLLYDPASSIELPKKPGRLPTQIFSVEEVEQILNYPNTETSHGLRNRAILEVLYSTGIRRSELVRLNLYDLNQDKGYLAVRQGKGGKDRVVPIGDRALAWVVKYIEEARPDLVLHADEWALFVSSEGVRFRSTALGCVISRILEASGVRNRWGSCHLFRHTMATMMLEGGADIRYVQEMLGHSKLETTQIYTKVSIAKLKAVHTASHPGAGLNRRVEEAAEDIN